MARLLLLSPLIWCPIATAKGENNAPGQLHIWRDGAHLTVQAQEVPQQELLEALAERLDFKLTLMGPLPQPRSLNIEGRPWEQALKQALSPANWALLYQRTDGQDRLVQVVVFPPDTQPHTVRRIGSEPAIPEPAHAAGLDHSAIGKEDQAQEAQSLEEQDTAPSEPHAQESQREFEGDYDNSATSQ